MNKWFILALLLTMSTSALAGIRTLIALRRKPDLRSLTWLMASITAKGILWGMAVLMFALKQFWHMATPHIWGVSWLWAWMAAQVMLAVTSWYFSLYVTGKVSR